jgi:hypothetical protein
MKRFPFVQPLVQRWRESPSGVIAPSDARRPFRLWMTGSLAVVMAAMLPLRVASETERNQALRVLRHSRFGVTETLQRIEVTARDRGLSVLAMVPGTPSALVLAASIGGTLVVMSEADSRPAMPMSMMVREAADGGADVLVMAVPDAQPSHDWSDLPTSVVDELQALPEVVARALA